GPGAATEGNLVGRLLRDHLARRLPGLVGPERVWSFSYVDDVAAGIFATLERGRVGARHALGGENAPQRGALAGVHPLPRPRAPRGENAPERRAFEILQQLRGRRPPLRIPYPIAGALGSAEELRVTLFGGTPLITRGAVEIFRHDWPLASDAAAADLGYRITPL